MADIKSHKQLADIESHKKLFDWNIKRVCGLCKMYNHLKSNKIKEGKEYKFTDILRSAVVLLHSSFEEYYRSILGDILPNTCTEEDLKNMSFLGSAGNHKDKITLGGLVKLRDKTVDQLITESIRESLSFTSFNEYRDIVSWSKKIKIDLSEFKDQEKLNKLIHRRHKIVHEADYAKADNAKSDDKYALTRIRESSVEEWIEVVRNLVKLIDKEVHKGYKNGNIQV